MTGFQIFSLTVCAFALFILSFIWLIQYLGRGYSKYSSDIREVDRRFEILEKTMSEEDKKEAIRIMKIEIQELFDEFGSHCRFAVRENVSGLGKCGFKGAFKTQDMFDYAQGYFKCYNFVKIGDFDTINHIFHIDENTHLKMI
ncbi:MAG: hypothetical protein CL760_05120 [Chloroflexi bacterium]|nr:hypothetical protein [Chloroflexota bacterium]|tara:strand:- start:2688 stop:3116 length:429 start_codon:yes stop_codon:yes gene_type:complete